MYFVGSFVESVREENKFTERGFSPDDGTPDAAIVWGIVPTVRPETMT